jgi:hypothetical protein
MHEPGAIHSRLAADHRRLEGLFREATSDSRRVDMEKYALFRAGLLRHIGAEEKILIPAANAPSDDLVVLAARIRADHGAITALLVPPPSPTILRALDSILQGHDVLEEAPDGLYSRCEHLLSERAGEVLTRLEAAPQVRVSPHNADPGVIPAVQRALARAGYEWSRFEVSTA